MDLSDLVLPDMDLEPKIVTATIEGVLEESDLRQLLGDVEIEQAAEGKSDKALTPEFLPVEEPTDLQRLRERHHSVARLIAKGMQQSLVARITGYSQSYLSTLLNSPAMIELVEMYRIQNGAAAEVIAERLKTVGLKAIDKIEDKLEQEDASIFELTAIAKLGLDRAGHGPSSKQHIVTESHIVDHAEIKRLNQEALRASAEVIIPVSEVRKALPSREDRAEGDSAEGLGDAGN